MTKTGTNEPCHSLKKRCMYIVQCTMCDVRCDFSLDLKVDDPIDNEEASEVS